MKNIYILLAVLISCGKKELTEPSFDQFNNNLQPPVQLVDSVVYYNLNDRRKADKIKGLSVSLINNHEILFSEYLGVADTISNKLVTDETLFQFGSISKPVAAVGALLLVDQGKLDLDQDVNEYLKSWKVKGDYIVTLRQLLSHTGGINVSGFGGYQKNEELPDSTADILDGRYKNDSIKVVNEPGRNWQYSGGGYVIVQKIIEDITGVPYSTYINQEIFQPLGMRHSFFQAPEGSSRSSGHDSSGKIIDGSWKIYPIPSAAGLWSTTEDIARFCLEIQRVLRGDEGILSREVAVEMLQEEKNHWGLGFELSQTRDSITVFQHKGNTSGFTTQFVALMDGRGICVATNVEMEEQLIPEIVRSASTLYDWQILDPMVIEEQTIEMGELLTFSGRYKYEKIIPGLGEYYTEYQLLGKRLFLLGKKRNIRLIPVSASSFILYETGNKLEFGKDEKGDFYLMDGIFRFDKVTGG